MLCILSPVFSINTQEWDYFWHYFGTNCVISYTCPPSKISVLTFSKVAGYNCCTVLCTISIRNVSLTFSKRTSLTQQWANCMNMFNMEFIFMTCSLNIASYVLYVTGAWKWNVVFLRTSCSIWFFYDWRSKKWCYSGKYTKVQDAYRIMFFPENMQPKHSFACCLLVSGMWAGSLLITTR